jgi:hypothetical protein
MRRRKPLTPTERQRRWRKKKRQAEIAAGLRARKSRPKTAAEIKRAYRARLKAKAAAARVAASRERRRMSRAAPQIEPEFRVGDCREMLADIADESAALIVTDPPWQDTALPLIPWLAGFAARILVSGGSLLCVTGGDNFLEAATILSQHLNYYWVNTMLFDRKPLLRAKAIRACGRHVMWFIKGARRRSRLVVQDVSQRHRNGQGIAPLAAGRRHLAVDRTTYRSGRPDH